MNKNFDWALENAFEKEFCWLDSFENPYANYEFSSQFESSMKTIIPKAEFTYVSIGKRRIRKTLLAALVALLAVLITGCAFGVYYLVEWNEIQNDKQGTLDITFDINGEHTSDLNTPVLPKSPAGYTITEQFNDDSSCIIVYSDAQQNQIIYSQSNDIENMSVSIDNEDADFTETIINGYKGYTSSKAGVNALYWADSTYFYELQGTCDMDVLYGMIEIDSEESTSSDLPTTPKGYTIVTETSDEFSHMIRYSNDNGLLISFTKYIGLENRSISIDNEDATLNETTINGYKGYTYFKDGLNVLYWTDTENFYLLQGTCDMDVLYEMIEK